METRHANYAQGLRMRWAKPILAKSQHIYMGMDRERSYKNDQDQASMQASSTNEKRAKVGTRKQWYHQLFENMVDYLLHRR